MLEMLFRFVACRYIAIAHSRYPSCVPCITVPVLSENMGRLGQSRQRCVMLLCLMLDWTLKDPQYGQNGPPGHRWAAIHSPAASLVGNIPAILTSDMPLRSDFPGALCAIFPPSLIVTPLYHGPEARTQENVTPVYNSPFLPVRDVDPRLLLRDRKFRAALPTREETGSSAASSRRRNRIPTAGIWRSTTPSSRAASGRFWQSGSRPSRRSRWCAPGPVSSRSTPSTKTPSSALIPRSRTSSSSTASADTASSNRQAPVRAIAELIAFGSHRTLDLGRFSFDRLVREEPLQELAVV